MSLNILFTCAGRRNYLINYFKEALKGRGRVIAADAQMNAAALAVSDQAEILPDIYSDHYIDSLLELCIKNQVKALISLNDLELPILAARKQDFRKIGTQVIVSDPSVIDTAFDKWKTGQFISKIGLNSPKTYLSLEDAKEALANKSLEFPLVLKPRFGSASIGIEFPETIEELELCYRLQSIKLNKSILKEASKSDMDHALIIQEKLEGDEFGMDVLNDFEGNYYGSYARQKISMRSGETDKAVSVIDPHLEETGRIIGQNLKQTGSMDCDLFLHKGKVYVLEINPRFGGGYPFSHESGINIAAIYIAWLLGEKDVHGFDNYKGSQSFSKCDQLIRNLET